MKTIKNSVLLWAVALLPLAGCTSVQSHPLYSAWQAQVYGMYGMQPNAVGVTRAPLTYMPQQGYISPVVTVSAPMSGGERRYVAAHYGLN